MRSTQPRLCLPTALPPHRVGFGTDFSPTDTLGASRPAPLARHSRRVVVAPVVHRRCAQPPHPPLGGRRAVIVYLAQSSTQPPSLIPRAGAVDYRRDGVPPRTLRCAGTLLWDCVVSGAHVRLWVWLAPHSCTRRSSLARSRRNTGAFQSDASTLAVLSAGTWIFVDPHQSP